MSDKDFADDADEVTQPEGATPEGAEAAAGTEEDAAGQAPQEEAPEAESAGPESTEAESPEEGAPSGEPEGEGADGIDLEARVLELEDQVARARAETYNVSQEYAGFVRRSKADQAAAREAGQRSVIDALLSVLDDIELTRQHGELTGSAGASCEKLENALAANFDLHRFGAEGDEFDPTMHEALMHTTGDVTSEQVQTLIQPGYRLGEKVIRPARVGVVSPQ